MSTVFIEDIYLDNCSWWLTVCVCVLLLGRGGGGGAGISSLAGCQWEKEIKGLRMREEGVDDEKTIIHVC